jgi:cytosine/adenosine deaminase-related metal-dependent hydrolase
MNRLLNLQNIKWACHHLHIDKSKSIDINLLTQSQVHMKDKWHLMQNIKRNYNEKDLKKKMLSTTVNLHKQGCKHMRTFIDVDDTVGLKLLHYAVDLKRYWKQYGVDLQIGTQLLNGLETQENIDLFYKAADIVDFLGCLPSRDSDPSKHLEIVFNKGLELNKPIEAHLDQCNIPSEKETELFCDFVEQYNYQGKARAIHSVSLACHPIDYQKKIAQKMYNLDIGLIVCPSAAISMTQHNEFYAPIHNSIAPVKLLLEEGVSIGLGVDNVEDIFMPFCDGDLLFELRLLAESERIYKPEVLTSIATNTMGFT